MTNNRTGQAKAPKLPEFREGRDDIESYLLRFERFTASNNRSRVDWAIHLSALLSGKALDMYSRLNEAESNDYDIVQKALLTRYNFTSEGFNKTFRTSRPEVDERMSQLKTRLENYLTSGWSCPRETKNSRKTGRTCSTMSKS